MSELKMSDIFELPLIKGYRSVYIDNDSKPCILSGNSSCLIARPKFIEHVIHAVNSHDGLVSQLKQVTKERDELKETVTSMRDQLSKAHYLGPVEISFLVASCAATLAKLNQ